MAPRRSVLVLGGSGWLGRVVVPRFAREFDVHAPSHREVDVSDRSAVREALATTRAAVAVNLAAANPPADGESMERVNALGAGTVAEEAARAGVRLLHLSTDLVLDGRSPPYAEDAAVRPLQPYGRSKAAGEEAVRRAGGDALVLRTSLVVDASEPDRFSRSVLDRLARGDTATLFVDEIRCPVFRPTLADALAELVDRHDVTGTLHVAGTQTLSRHELALRLLPRFGATGLDGIRTGRAAEAPPEAGPRPLDLTLDVSRARSLLRTPLRSVDEELAGPRAAS